MPCIRSILILLLLASVCPASAAQLHWVPPRLDVGETTILGKAYYSSDNDLGAGFELLRPFRFPGASVDAPDAELRLKGRFTQNGHVRASARGTVFFDRGRLVLRSRIRFDNLYRRFWGIGGGTPSSNEELYRPHNTFLYVEVIRSVAAHLKVGVRAEYQDFGYSEVEGGGLLDTRGYRGTELDNVLGGGLVLDYDTRDDRYAPRHGFYGQAMALFFQDELSSDFTFNNYNVDLRAYLPVGHSRVLALQAFSWLAQGSAPIWRFAELGGRPHSRGYRHARYIDKALVATQAELRFPVRWRVSAAAFGGVAVVGPRLSSLRADQLRPTTGGGLRWKVFEDRDVVLRGDLAFGQASARAFLTFGQAF